MHGSQRSRVVMIWNWFQRCFPLTPLQEAIWEPWYLRLARLYILIDTMGLAVKAPDPHITLSHVSSFFVSTGSGYGKSRRPSCCWWNSVHLPCWSSHKDDKRYFLAYSEGKVFAIQVWGPEFRSLEASMDKVMHICNHSIPTVRRDVEIRDFSDTLGPAR